MRKKLIGVIVSVVAAVSLPLSVRCQAPSLAELLPADSLGYVELPELEVFYYLISEVGETALASLEEEQEFPEDIKVKCKAVLGAFNEIKPLLPKSGSLGIVSVDPQRGQPSIVLACELSQGLAPLASAATKLLAVAPNFKVKETEYGYEVVIPDAPIPPIGVAVRDNVLYAAAGEGLLDRMLSRPSTGTLAQTAHFKEVNGVIGEDDIISGYLNLEAILKQLMPILPDQAMQVVEILGLKHVQAAGLSVSANEKMVGFNLALQYVKDAPGIASLLSLPNSKPKGMEYVPADYSYAVRLCLGPPDQQLKNVCAMLEKAGMGQQVAGRIAAMKENMGIDVEKVLASLGGEITLGVKIPETLGIPNVVMCIEARDPDYLMGLIKNLLGGEQAPMAVTEMELSGRKTMMLTPKIPIPVSPVLAVDGDVIVVGISNAVLQKALAAKASGQNIASKPSFREAMEGLPADSNVGLEYVELDGLGQLAMAGMGMAMAQVPSEIKPMLAKAMPYVARSVQNLGAATRATYRTPNGLAVQSRMGTPAVMGLLRNGAALAVKGLMLRGSRAEEAETVATEALAVEEIPAERIEGEFTEEGKSFVDLDAHVTSPLKGMHNNREGNDLPFEPGLYRMSGDVFRIEKGVIQLKGQLVENAPEEVRGVKVGHKLQKLHVLHATGYGENLPDGTQIGSYVIHYEDGAAAEIPLRYGVHVRDWWMQADSRPVSEGKIAWSGRNQLSPIRLYSMTWENPHPDKVVATIDCRSTGTMCAPFVVAMTAEAE